MTSISSLTKAVFGNDAPIRAGYSDQHQAAFVVAVDLKKAMQFLGDTNKFVKSLEIAQRARNSDAPPYFGNELVASGGGPQQTRVIYKRGVFHLLMRSELPLAATYRDKVFDLLEDIERDGFVISPEATDAQLAAMPEVFEARLAAAVEARRLERVDYRNVLRAVALAGGDSEDYAAVQDAFYLGLFGATARHIRATQQQVTGERYRRRTRDRVTGVMHEPGELRPSPTAKDYLTAEQLGRLDTGVLLVTSFLALRHPDGQATLDEVKAAVAGMGRTATAAAG